MRRRRLPPLLPQAPQAAKFRQFMWTLPRRKPTIWIWTQRTDFITGLLLPQRQQAPVVRSCLRHTLTRRLPRKMIAKARTRRYTNASQGPLRRLVAKSRARLAKKCHRHISILRPRPRKIALKLGLLHGVVLTSHRTTTSTSSEVTSTSSEELPPPYFDTTTTTTTTTTTPSPTP